MLIKKIKNNTGSPVIYLGQEIAAGAYYQIEQTEELFWIIEGHNASSQLAIDIASGDAVVNDNTSDLSPADGIAWLTATNTDCIREVEVDESAIAEGFVPTYNSTSGKLEYKSPLDTLQPPAFTEAINSILTTSSGTWVDRTLVGFENQIVQIMIINDSVGDRTIGARAKGSSLGRTLTVPKAMHALNMLVKVDSNGVIQIYSSGDGVLFYNLGGINNVLV